MTTPASTPLSPGGDTVGRWINSMADADLIIDGENMEYVNNQSLLPQGDGSMDGDLELFENAQRIMSQDLMVPDSIPSSMYPQIDKNTKKRQRDESTGNQREELPDSKRVKIPAWLRAEDALRTCYWNTSKSRKILKTRYVIPQCDDELTCYHLTDAKTPFYVRVLCSFFIPQKIPIGAKGGLVGAIRGVGS